MSDNNLPLVHAQGEVLLEVHNTHHFQGFLSAIRGALKAGTFAEYRSWFCEGRFKAAHQQLEQQAQTGGQVEDQGTETKAWRTDRDRVGGVKRPAWTSADGKDIIEGVNAKHQRTQQ